MADYTNSKKSVGALYPENATDTAWQRLEPLITPEQLKSRHLFGIPLISAMRDPITNKAQIMTDEMLKDIIIRSVSIAETETGLDIFPVQRKEKHPFDRQLYEAFGYFQTRHRPIYSIDSLTVTPSNDQDLYIVAPDWVETGYLPLGQINIIPLTIATTAFGQVSPVATGGALFLSIFANKQWIPAFWQIQYTSGFIDGNIPREINELIGTIAAIEALSMLAATYARTTSASLGIDAMSQSTSTPGPQLFRVRLEELAEKRRFLVNRLKTGYGLKLSTGNV